MTRAADILPRLEGVRVSGSGWMAKCPAHDDKKASLSVTETDSGELLMHCHAGCAFAKILDALGGPVKSSAAPPVARPKEKPKAVYKTPLEAIMAVPNVDVVAEWAYHQIGGEVAFYVYRTEGPDGKSYRPVSRTTDGWQLAAAPSPRPLYRLPKLSQGRIYVAEGEKAADAAASIGLVATTSSGGADTAQKTDWAPLAGRDVVILPDNDKPGQKYAKSVAKILAALEPPANVKIINLPGLPPKGDAVEYIAAQRSAGWSDQDICDAVDELVTASAPPKTFPEELADGLKKDPGHAWEAIDQITEAFASGRAEWSRVATVLRKAGCLKDIELEVRKRTGKVKPLHVIDGGNEPKSTRIVDILPGAPADESATVPPGWILRPDSDNGKPALQRLVAKMVQGMETVLPVAVSHNPIIISAWLANRQTGGKMLEVSWRAGGKWHSRVAPREKLMASQQIVATLATYGFPVSSGNAADIVAYLCDYERHNVAHAIPTRTFADHLGWQPDGGFVVGDERIGCEGTVFQGADGGDDAMASRFRSAGTLDGWRKAITVVHSWPKVELALYASLAAPLLELLRAPGFVIDWAGGSSTGKTTTLCVGASCWGVPDERDPASLVVSWATTDVGMERYAALLGSLPLFLDESKRAKVVGGKSTAPEIVYALANGQGKARGSKAGLQAVRHWRTIVLTNGEQSLIRMSKDGGLAGRVLTLWGSPFGGIDQRVAGLTTSMLDHYGHAGPVFVRWLVEHRDDLPLWRERFAALSAIYTTRLTSAGGGAPTRLAAYLATLELCAELAHPLLELPWQYRSPISLCCDEIAGKSVAVDRSKEAVDWVYSQAAAQQCDFFGRHNAEMRPPTHGWAGAWSSRHRWSCICFLAPWLERTLKDGGFDFDATIQHWQDKGWLLCSSDRKRHQRLVSIGGVKVRTYALRRDCLGLSKKIQQATILPLK